MDGLIAFGSVILLLCVQQIPCQVCPSTIANCDVCSGNNCVQCSDGYTFGSGTPRGCCRPGCIQDSQKFPSCDITTMVCQFTGCLDGYIGPTCEQCSNVVENCDLCRDRQSDEQIVCTDCADEFFLTSTSKCCLEGCDVCNDRICSECKGGWFLYAGGCDRCGEHCLEPANQTARCDRTTGVCLYGCEAGWHGSNCSRLCDLNNCQICGYDEPINSLFCTTCAPGYWGPQCDLCSANCVADPFGSIDICHQNGTCRLGCQDGYRGARCDVRCENTSGLENCHVCARTNLECSVCKTGYWRNRCQFTCGANCVPLNGIPYCNIADGRCTDGCNNGYWSSNCSIACPNCASGVCIRDTGVCTTSECNPGFYSSTCMNACPSNCAPNRTTNRAYCDFTTGECIGCQFNYFGNRCTEVCSPNCNELVTNTEPHCDQQGGACKQACKQGYYLQTCTANCTSMCVDETCDITSGICAECNKTQNQQGYLCPTGNCPVGRHGTFCNQVCPTNCANDTCMRNTGLCTRCTVGYHGSTCNATCFNCRDNLCFQTDGECEKDCKDGWYTETCNTRCKHEGCQTCHIVTGECITCKVGYYGDTDCGQQCERTCAPDNNNLVTCNKLTGNCDSGRCLEGYYGTRCNQKCSVFCSTKTCGYDLGTCDPCLTGYFGQRCTGVCSTRCKNKDCIVRADQCQQGCTTGYWGSRCENNCSANCEGNTCEKETGRCTFGCIRDMYWGQTCLELCKENCVGRMCNRTGYCTDACEVGFYGDQCENRCSDAGKCTDGTCDRHSGNCPACFTDPQGNTCPTAECPSGKRGNLCLDDCTSDTCQYDRCDRYADVCIGCPNGRWGSQCENLCPNCKTGTGCLKTSGECIESCQDGWYGPLCDRQCPSLCTSCGRDNGECITCVAGRYGNQCMQNCSSHCKETIVNGNNMIYCNKATGACQEGACKPNYWGQACNMTCGQNCKLQNGLRLCALLDGACTYGCIDTYYGSVCERLCSDRCQDKLCVDFEDRCTLGCAEGYHGPTCSGTCSPYCVGGKCRNDTGKCLNGCEPDYYGDRCVSNCIYTCLDGTCGADGSCADCKIDPIGQGCRVQVCQAGLYGPTCESECPGKFCLNNQCHRLNGTCNLGCLTNYYGEYCTGICNCDSTGTFQCDHRNGTCICNNGYYGTRCELTCNEGCLRFRCDRDGKCTEGCKVGRYGDSCESTCNTCLANNCNSQTGECVQGCVDGYHGLTCQSQCHENCLRCDRNTGQCLQCRPEFYNLPDCDRACSSNCMTPSGGRTCSQTDGSCIAGCKSGYYGSQCSSTCGNCFQDDCNSVDGSCIGCDAGWWGTTCNERCSDNCASSGSQVSCRQSDGRCNLGCLDGFYGTSCSSVCSDRCTSGRCTSANTCTLGCVAPYYGKNTGCQHMCSNCKFELCSDLGVCDSTYGCKDGFFGTDCTKSCTSTCKDETCDISNGDCSDCRLSPKGPNCREQDTEDDSRAAELTVGEILGISAGCLGVVLIFVTLLICCVFYRRKAHDLKNEIHLPSDVLERLSTHHSLRSSASTGYPVARVVGDDEKDFVLF